MTVYQCMCVLTIQTHISISDRHAAPVATHTLVYTDYRTSPHFGVCELCRSVERPRARRAGGRGRGARGGDGRGAGHFAKKYLYLYMGPYLVY